MHSLWERNQSPPPLREGPGPPPPLRGGPAPTSLERGSNPHLPSQLPGIRGFRLLIKHCLCQRNNFIFIFYILLGFYSAYNRSLYLMKEVELNQRFRALAYDKHGVMLWLQFKVLYFELSSSELDVRNSEL